MTVRGADRTYYDVKIVRGITRAPSWMGSGVGGGGGAALVVLALVILARSIVWIAKGRRWTVQVTRYPTLRGDDQTTTVVFETGDLDRTAAIERVRTVSASIRSGQPPSS